MGERKALPRGSFFLGVPGGWIAVLGRCLEGWKEDGGGGDADGGRVDVVGGGGDGAGPCCGEAVADTKQGDD